MPFSEYGRVTASASVKNEECELGNTKWLALVNSFSEQYVGSHSVDKLLQLPVDPVWLVIPEYDNYRIWALRDCSTRRYDRLLSKQGNFFDKINQLISSDNSIRAAEIYVDWIVDYNWNLMQMRLLQTGKKIDTTDLLNSNGIESVIDQMDCLRDVADPCRAYHKTWLQHQNNLSEPAVIGQLAAKLSKFVSEV